MSLHSIIFCALLALLPITNYAGMTPEEVKVFNDYKLKAEKGDPNAQIHLGGYYADGKGVLKDEVEALKWYRKSADQGYPVGQFAMGVFYRKGILVSRDDVEGVKWYRKAAEQGYAPAQMGIGLSYGLGEGVPRDLVEAYAWLNLAAASDTFAREMRDTFEKERPSSEIQEGQRRSRELQQLIDKKKAPSAK